MKLDILAIGAHPDDIELSCAGTILKEIADGKKVGVLDLTQGETGYQRFCCFAVGGGCCFSKSSRIKLPGKLRFCRWFF